MNRGLNFRPRPIDISKPLQIFIGELQGETEDYRNRGYQSTEIESETDIQVSND